MKELKDYLHFYLPYECLIKTPDGIGKLVGLPWSIKCQDQYAVHFGKVVKTVNSIDGGYSKARNYGVYAIKAQRYEPIGTKGITEDGFSMPGGAKLILRPLSSLSNDEAISIGILPKKEWHEQTQEEQIKWLVNNKENAIYSPEDFLYLLSKHFDLFGLIEAGHAIDKSTLK